MCAAPGGCRGASAWGGALCSHSGRTRTPAVPAKDSPDLRPVSGEDGVAGALRVNPRCARAPTQGRHVAHRRGFLPPGTCPGPATLHTHNSYTAERSQTTSRRGHLGLRRPRDAGTGRGHCPPWTSCPWGRTANRPPLVITARRRSVSTGRVCSSAADHPAEAPAWAPRPGIGHTVGSPRSAARPLWPRGPGLPSGADQAAPHLRG